MEKDKKLYEYEEKIKLMQEHKEINIKEMENGISEMEKNMNETKENNFFVLNNLRDENYQLSKTIEVTNELVQNLEAKIDQKDNLISEQENIIIELNNNLSEFIQTNENQDGLLNNFKALMEDRNKEIAKVAESMLKEKELAKKFKIEEAASSDRANNYMTFKKEGQF